MGSLLANPVALVSVIGGGPCVVELAKQMMVDFVLLCLEEFLQMDWTE